MAASLTDTEFGTIALRRNRLSRAIRLKIDGRGLISISMPLRTPLFFAKQLLNNSRPFIRNNLQKLTRTQLKHGDLIGKTHRLAINQGELTSRLIGTTLHVSLPDHLPVESPSAQAFIKEAALKALRTQAKAYLSRQLEQLAQKYGFSYTKLRFTNAGTRWGSCSSQGTISLNIWLMQLPFDHIDYVLIHELCHTRHMNHSPNFWGLVETILPNYRQVRHALKQHHPYA
jgi:predicted metal-dependent hydrolase